MFEHPAEFRDKAGAVHLVQTQARLRRMGDTPMVSDVDAARRPDAFEPFDIVDKAFQRLYPSGPPDQTAMQPDRHHLGLPGAAFGIKRIEGIAQIGIELIARIKALRRGKAHIVAIKSIGDNQLSAPCYLHPIGQIIVVCIRDIVEGPRLCRQRDRVHRAAPRVPATRRCADDLAVQADRLVHIGAFDLGGVILVVDPFQPVACDFPIGLGHRLYLLRGPRQGGGDAINGNRDIGTREQAVQPPKARPRAVVIDGFHVPVALPRPRGGPDDLGQEGL